MQFNHYCFYLKRMYRTIGTKANCKKKNGCGRAARTWKKKGRKVSIRLITSWGLLRSICVKGRARLAFSSHSVKPNQSHKRWLSFFFSFLPFTFSKVAEPLLLLEIPCIRRDNIPPIHQIFLFLDLQWMDSTKRRKNLSTTYGIKISYWQRHSISRTAPLSSHWLPILLGIFK